MKNYLPVALTVVAFAMVGATPAFAQSYQGNAGGTGNIAPTTSWGGSGQFMFKGSNFAAPANVPTEHFSGPIYMYAPSGLATAPVKRHQKITPVR